MKSNDPSTQREAPPNLGQFADKKRVQRGCWAGLTNLWLIIGSLGMALLGVVTLSLISSAMSKDPERYRDISSVVRTTLDHRGWFTALSVIPAVIGLAAIHPRMSVRTAWILRAIGTLFLAAMISLVVMAFFALVSPLYQYQPI